MVRVNEPAGVAPSRDTRDVLVNVQALRAIAALLVVLFHLADMAAPLGVAKHNLSFAALGVDLFFVISGFIMVFTTDRAPTTGSRFLKNRIARVVPLYWVVTIGVFAIALIAPALLRRTDANWFDLIRSLLFIPYARADGTMQPVMFLGWSLNYEMFFYLVFAAALAAGRGRYHVEIAIAVIVALVVLGGMAGISPTTLPGFYVNAKMLEFAAGMGIARLLPRMRGNAALAVAGLVAGSAWLVATPQLFLGSVATVNAAIACSVILIAALSAERAGLVARWPLIVLLGDASYSLYLTHPLITQAVVKVWQTIGAAPAVAAIAIPVTIVVCAAVSIVVYRAVEMPLSRAARGLLGARRAAIPARGL